jgi:hypothetical protein
MTSDRLCFAVPVPDHIRRRFYADLPGHEATEFVAFRMGGNTVCLCIRCATLLLGGSAVGDWTRAGHCAICGITVYLSRLARIRHRRNLVRLVCSPKCGRTLNARLHHRRPQRYRHSETEPMRKAAMAADEAIAQAKRLERQRTDQLILQLWPEEEAYR